MDDLIDAIHGFVLALIVLTLLTPIMVIRSLRALLTKTPPDSLGES